ncbi:MAG TPA: hypothetical protein VFM12_03985 [Gemmatimonadales bacterium]|jgi:hypothetical protein|nr:hypothetical protein [Gemmatimonadales bacterium]
MTEHDEIYGKDRAERLKELLRDLSARIAELDKNNSLLAGVPELLRRLGELRSELFHYEVRQTYDTPETAESRRIVDEAQRNPDFLTDDPEDDEPWRQRPAE